MRAKITQAQCKSARAFGKRQIYTDTLLPGFRLVISPTGRTAFTYRYRVGGGRNSPVREPKIGDWPAMPADRARRIAMDWFALVRQGRDPSAKRQADRAALTMDALFARYMSDHAWVKKKRSSAIEDERLIRLHLSPAFGKRKVADLARSEVDRLHKSMADRPGCANRCLSLLSKACNLAEVWGLRPDGSNPVRHIGKFPERPRQRYLSGPEFARLGESLCRAEAGDIKDDQDRSIRFCPYSIAAIRLLALTGARRGEILGLRWEMIDWEHGRAMLPDSKTGAKNLPLNGPAIEILMKIPRLDNNPFVIAGGKPGAALVNIKDPWAVIRRDAGLDDVRLHDLRHSFASVGVMGGLSLPKIGAILGHTQAQTTARYTHIADDPIRSASDFVARRVAKAMLMSGWPPPEEQYDESDRQEPCLLREA